MRLPKKFVTITAAGVLALGGLGVAATVVAPMASAVTVAAADADTGTERVKVITDALADLVSGGSITQEQAAAVATTLAESDALRGGGHHGRRLLDLEAAATALGMSEDDLRTALDTDGATLSTVAEAQGVEVSTLSEALTAAATTRIEQRVTDGDLDQEEADEKLAALPDRITALLTDEDVADHHGRGGNHDADETTEDEAAESAAGV